MFVTGLVLAAGGSSRLDRPSGRRAVRPMPKQLLPYRERPLLQAALDLSVQAGFDQRIVAVGRAADEVLAAVDVGDADVVVNQAYGTGCSSSIGAALARVDERAHGIVLLLGDQPLVAVESITALVDAATPDSMGVCRYRDGRGHPFWLGRSAFADLAEMHGDKGVWKVLESGRHRVVEVPVDADVPLDVDTWEDYETLLAATTEEPSA